jgi:adenosine deaminase
MTELALAPGADLARTAAALPKVLLHEHLDGSLRLGTLLELLRERGITPPADDEAALGRWFDANANAGSLERYLQAFALTIAAMASPEALRRVAFEAAEDARAQGALLAEFRIAPLLFEPHGLSGDTVIEALLEGLSASPLPSGLIAGALRTESAADVTRAAALSARWFERTRRHRVGVVGFDLAGAERGFPPSMHAAALALVHEAGLPLTLHAGEADEAERVIEAGRLGATRIGHGVRLVDALADPARAHRVDEAKALGLHLEVCPTSNVHTGAAASIASHPITALWQAGVSLSYHTDNTLMSRITHSHEARVLLAHTPLTEHDLRRMALAAAQASFLPEPIKQAVMAQVSPTLTPTLSLPAAEGAKPFQASATA